MSKWLGQQFGKRKQKTRQLREKEFNTDSLRSLIDRAVTDAEQIVASIKTKAQTEAEDEAARIIDQAKHEADEIGRRAEVAARKEAKDILSALNNKAEPVQLQKKTKRKTEEARKAKEVQKRIKKGTTLAAKVGALKKKLTKPIQLKEEAPVSEPAEAIAEELPEQAGKEAELAAGESDLEEKGEQPAQLEKEVTVSEPGEAIAEPAETITDELPKLHHPEEKPNKEEFVSAPIKLDSQALYNGEVELAVAVPVDPVAVSRLYNYLQTTPEIKILYTRGSWDRGTILAVTLDKPLPLIGMISKIPGIEVTPGLPQKDNFVKGTSSSLLRAERKRVTRIDLTLKER